MTRLQQRRYAATAVFSALRPEWVGESALFGRSRGRSADAAPIRADQRQSDLPLPNPKSRWSAQKLTLQVKASVGVGHSTKRTRIEEGHG